MNLRASVAVLVALAGCADATRPDLPPCIIEWASPIPAGPGANPPDPRAPGQRSPAVACDSLTR